MMVANSNGNGLIRIRDWLWVIFIVAGASVANVSMMYKLSNDQACSLLALDERWQKRIADLDMRWQDRMNDLRKEMLEIKAGIPPQWFEVLVRQNQTDIRELTKLVRDHIIEQTKP